MRVKHVLFKWFKRFYPFNIFEENEFLENFYNRSFIFTESCKYDLDPEIHLDWNTLYGLYLGFFRRKKNLVKFVWRYDNFFDKIEIGAFWVIDGKKNWQSLNFIPIGSQVNLKMEFYDDCVVFKVLDDLIVKSKYCLYFKNNLLKLSRYKIDMSFNDKKRAPHKIEIIEVVN